MTGSMILIWDAGVKREGVMKIEVKETCTGYAEYTEVEFISGAASVYEVLDEEERIGLVIHLLDVVSKLVIRPKVW